MTPPVTCVVQARMGSSRLPGKVLADLGGVPLLHFMLGRLRALDGIHVVVATGDTTDDDPIAAAATDAGFLAVRGPEDDVLQRFQVAVDANPADIVVRLTADCPLIDPEVVRATVDLLRSSGSDYVSNTLVRTFPDGLDVESFRVEALEAAVTESEDPIEREHVTPFIYRRPERFRLMSLRNDEPLGRERWTVDTAEDLEFVRSLVAQLDRPEASWREILAVAGSRTPAAPRTLWLRPAFPSDEDLLFALRNDPDAVSFSGSARPVPLDEHRAWFRRCLVVPSKRIWIAEIDRTAVGQTRVDVESSVGTVSIAVAREHRGKGHASEMLQLLKHELHADHQVTVLLAQIHPENHASLRLFESAGFARDESLSTGLHSTYRWDREGGA